MLIVAIVLLVLIGLYVVLGSIRQKKLLINKGVILVTIIAVILIFISGHFSQSGNQQEVKYYQEIAPSIQKAPYILPTPSRAYYIATFQEDERYIVLTDFYYYDNGKKWEHTDIPLPLDKSLPGYSDLKILRRGG